MDRQKRQCVDKRPFSSNKVLIVVVGVQVVVHRVDDQERKHIRLQEPRLRLEQLRRLDGVAVDQFLGHWGEIKNVEIFKIAKPGKNGGRNGTADKTRPLKKLISNLNILHHELSAGTGAALVSNCSAGLTTRVEKYRPSVLADVVGNKETVESLKRIAEEGNMPHLIISGLPGIGKTTSVLCLAHELLQDQFRDAVLELNASDDRGIDVVRNKIKQFAQKKVQLPPGRHKIVILDEADSMTPGAQQALRRTMEIYSNTTRFAFACNQSSKIIEPLQSRCAILRYNKLEDEEILKKLLQIIKLENIEYTNDGLEALIFTAEGDMRQAINNLQSTFYGYGFVNSDNVYKIVDSPHPLVIAKMLRLCIKGDLDQGLDILRSLWSKGYSAIDIVSTSFKVLKAMYDIDEESRLRVIKIVGFSHMRVLEGVSTYLQLSCMLAKIYELNDTVKLQA